MLAESDTLDLSKTLEFANKSYGFDVGGFLLAN